MCGIIAGITQKASIQDKVLQQLKKLEYRGYDSSGIASICANKKLHVLHNTESIDTLTTQSKTLPNTPIAIAHTRWATHGQVSLDNAHPHTAGDRIALVHNGIIENHEALRRELADTSITWRSQTDSEVIVHLINQKLDQGETIVKAIEKTTQQLKGTYALAVIDKENPPTIYCIAHESSLIFGKSEQETFICSDQNAITEHCQQACQVINDIVFSVSAESITPHNDAAKLTWLPLQKTTSPQKQSQADSITHQEILEQTDVLKHLVDKHITSDTCSVQLPDGLAQILSSTKRILMLACGSSYYCAKAGRYWLEKVARIPTSVELASEFRYRDPIIEENTLLITLSQSGETLDTISAQRFLQRHHPSIKSLCIGNNSLSTLAQNSDVFWPTDAGPEIGVATTKVFTAQLFCLASLCCHMANKEQAQPLLTHLTTVSHWVEEVLSNREMVKNQADLYRDDESMLFCARGENYPVAQEAALKLKELAYIHAQGYASGELKHGPLALIEPELSTVFFANDDQYLDKIKSNISEVLARKGKVLIIGSASTVQKMDLHNPLIQACTITKEAPPSFLAPFTNAVASQLLAYYVAKTKNCAIDKPRNLAKCVTVE